LLGCFIIISLFHSIEAQELAETANPGGTSTRNILFGTSTVLSGSNCDLGEEMRRGILAALERENRTGPPGSDLLRLITLDDGYEPTRTTSNIRELIQKDNVLAMIGDVGNSTANVAVPLANEMKTLLFASYSGSAALRHNPPDRYVINFRASYREEIKAALNALITVGGVQPEEVAFFTQGDFSPQLGTAILEGYGLRDSEAVQFVGYDRNTLAVEGAVAQLLMAKNPPRAVLMIGTYAPSAKFVRLCVDERLKPIFLSLSFVDSDSFAKALGNINATVIVTQVVPPPTDYSLPIVRQYNEDLKVVDPLASPGFVSFEGYVSARILTLALGKIRGPPTRESVIDSLEQLGRFDLGLGEPLELSHTEHQANHRVWPTIFKAGQFVPVEWSTISALARRQMQP